MMAYLIKAKKEEWWKRDYLDFTNEENKELARIYNLWLEK